MGIMMVLIRATWARMKKNNIYMKNNSIILDKLAKMSIKSVAKKAVGAAALGGGAVGGVATGSKFLESVSDKAQRLGGNREVKYQHYENLERHLQNDHTGRALFDNYERSARQVHDNLQDLHNPENYTTHGLAMGGAIAAMHLGKHLMKSKGKGKMEKKASFNPFEAIVTSFIQELG